MSYRKHQSSYSDEDSDEEYRSSSTHNKGKHPSSSSYYDKKHPSFSSSLHSSHPSSSYRSSSFHNDKKYQSSSSYNDKTHPSSSSSSYPSHPSSSYRSSLSSYASPSSYNDNKHPPSSSLSHPSYSSSSDPSYSSSSYPSYSSSSHPSSSSSSHNEKKYLSSSSHSDANYQPSISSQGKHYAPAGITRPIYRGSDGKKIDNYLRSKDTKHIETARFGDFHTSNQRAAYFTYDKEYARELQPAGGKILRKDVPREMLRDQHKFDDIPDEEWYHVSIPVTYSSFPYLKSSISLLVEKCRRNERAEGRMRRVQKIDIIEGPVAHTSTESIVRPRPPTPREKFKPRIRGDEYVQQVVFKGDALERLRYLNARESP
ncbi:hypothetical protein HD806DRAFT_128299 [Xylariaceae sp. AK1471]|nr:hypothetical protein HD806DRAFT_128299 [Xylariaceae sp. AK1471]